MLTPDQISKIRLAAGVSATPPQPGQSNQAVSLTDKLGLKAPEPVQPEPQTNPTLDKIKNVAKGFVQTSPILKGAVDLGGKLYDHAPQPVKSLIDTDVDLVKGAAKTIPETISNVHNMIKPVTDTIRNTATDLGSKIVGRTPEQATQARQQGQVEEDSTFSDISRSAETHNTAQDIGKLAGEGAMFYATPEVEGAGIGAKVAQAGVNYGTGFAANASQGGDLTSNLIAGGINAVGGPIVNKLLDYTKPVAEKFKPLFEKALPTRASETTSGTNVDRYEKGFNVFKDMVKNPVVTDAEENLKKASQMNFQELADTAEASKKRVYETYHSMLDTVDKGKFAQNIKEGMKTSLEDLSHELNGKISNTASQAIEAKMKELQRGLRGIEDGTLKEEDLPNIIENYVKDLNADAKVGAGQAPTPAALRSMMTAAQMRKLLDDSVEKTGTSQGYQDLRNLYGDYKYFDKHIASAVLKEIKNNPSFMENIKDAGLGLSGLEFIATHNLPGLMLTLGGKFGKDIIKKMKSPQSALSKAFKLVEGEVEKEGQNSVKSIQTTAPNIKNPNKANISDTIPQNPGNVSDEIVDKSTKKSGFAQITKDIPEELSPLTEEAKKYKSAEEFMQKVKGGGTQYGDYTPGMRANMPAGYKNITEMGIDPEEMVTVYRGIDDLKGKIKNKKINDGDFVTTDFDSALSYTGDPKNVVEMQVPAKTLYNSEPRDFIDEPFYTGSEYIYTAKNTKVLPTDKQLIDLYNQVHGNTKSGFANLGALPKLAGATVVGTGGVYGAKEAIKFAKGEEEKNTVYATPEEHQKSMDAATFSNSIFNDKSISTPKVNTKETKIAEASNSDIPEKDRKQVGGILFGEVSNRPKDKQTFEANVILQIARNRKASGGKYKNMSILEILKEPNQFQAYGSPQYDKYMNDDISTLEKGKKEAVEEATTTPQNMKDLEGKLSYAHILYDTKGNPLPKDKIYLRVFKDWNEQKKHLIEIQGKKK